MWCRLAGRFMLWTNRQDEVLDVLDIRPGDRVLEVGYGPGGLIRLLATRTQAAHVQGVDPSSAMLDVATRTNRAAARAGRVKLRSRTGTGRSRDRWPEPAAPHGSPGDRLDPPEVVS
jgi:SAM-dependent methyltransferase